MLSPIAIFGLLLFLGKRDKKNFNPLDQNFILTFLFILVISFLSISLHYAIETFPLSDVDEVIETLKMPLNGFSEIFIHEWLSKSIPFALFIALFYGKPLYHVCHNKKRAAFFIPIAFIALMIYPTTLFFNRVSLSGAARYAAFFLNLSEKDQSMSTDFLDNHLSIIGPQDVTADTTTRNLVFIIMESAENTFNASMESIDSLAKEHLSFSDNESILGGGFSTVGATNTIQSSVAKTTGIPLLMLSQKTMGILQRSSDSFFGNVPTIYDILHHFGYNNVFMQGSDSDFAKTRLFFLTHGADIFYDNKRTSTIQDISGARNSKVLKEGFVEAKEKRPDENWKDAYLFQKVRHILDTIGSKSLDGGQPFSLTITTMDTHFPYGFLDEDCQYKPMNDSKEEILKTTYRCSSREITNLISWIKEQPYSKNTEIVIMGDHIFMGTVGVKDIDKNKRKWINLFINPQTNPDRKDRAFSSFDMAPTILESMGFHLKDSKMGIGTSLYSTKPTLIEKIGIDSLNMALKDLRQTQKYIDLMIH